MRTITTTYFDRLVAEAEEADSLKLTKLAENITRVIETTPVREKTAEYIYPIESFQKDVQEAIWNIIVRTADFHNTFIPSNKAQDIVDHYCSEIVDDIRKAAGLGDIGHYEPKLPGEELEVSDDTEA